MKEKRYRKSESVVYRKIGENFILVPPADFVIKDSDILLAIGKSGDITKIKKMKVE